MNSQLAYVNWTKKNFPAVYQAAVAKVQRKTAFGGLGDDLLSDISFDSGSVSASDDINYDTSSSSNTNAPSSSVDWSGIITSVASAIPTVASSIVSTQNQLSLIHTNAQLAAQGKPLVNSLVNPNLAATSQNSILILGALGLGLVALMMSGRSGSSKSV